MKKRHKIKLIGIAIAGIAGLFAPSIAEVTKHKLDKPNQEQTKARPEADHKKVTYSIEITREVED